MLLDDVHLVGSRKGETGGGGGGVEKVAVVQFSAIQKGMLMALNGRRIKLECVLFSYRLDTFSF